MFLPRSLRTFKILANIFFDLQKFFPISSNFLHNSCQDLQGSSKGHQVLARFKKIFKNLPKFFLVLSRFTTILGDH